MNAFYQFHQYLKGIQEFRSMFTGTMFEVQVKLNEQEEWSNLFATPPACVTETVVKILNDLKGKDLPVYPIGKTWEGQEIFGFEVNEDEPFAIWVKDKHGITAYHMTRLHDSSIAIELEGGYAEFIQYEFFGDTRLMNFSMEHSADAKPMPPEKAAKWLQELEQHAYTTEEDVVWDNVTKAYYEGDSQSLPQHIFWSEYAGWFAGAGFEEGRLSGAIENPQNELWPLFDLAGRDAILQLRECFAEKKHRRIEADRVLAYSEVNGVQCFGYFSDYHDLDCRDAINWLQCLSGESYEATQQAELDTIEQIDKWLQSKQAEQQGESEDV